MAATLLLHQLVIVLAEDIRGRTEFSCPACGSSRMTATSLVLQQWVRLKDVPSSCYWAEFTVLCNRWSWNIMAGKYCGAVETNLAEFRLEMFLTLCWIQVRPGWPCTVNVWGEWQCSWSASHPDHFTPVKKPTLVRVSRLCVCACACVYVCMCSKPLGNRWLYFREHIHRLSHCHTQ